MGHKMICPECQKQGLTSKVFIGISTATSVYPPPFYDEEGRRHKHDPSTIITEYYCSKGHNWSESISGKCWCGWSKE